MFCRVVRKSRPFGLRNLYNPQRNRLSSATLVRKRNTKSLKGQLRPPVYSFKRSSTLLMLIGASATTGVWLTFKQPGTLANCSQRSKADRAQVKKLVESLQSLFVDTLQNISHEKKKKIFKPAAWKRDGGKHGGGMRFETENTEVFARATINVSQVYYDDIPDSKVDSATALSVILHPDNPFAPSLHFHISYIEPREGKPYWRMIADLNPSVQNPEATSDFEDAIRKVVPSPLYRYAKDFGDMYFYIPTLKRFRGTSHLFIAKLDEDDMNPRDGIRLAEQLGQAAIKVYAKILEEANKEHPKNSITELDRDNQLSYHTLYFYQVLTLDRGTTHGLLSHSDNDIGTLGSLPPEVDPNLLQTWKSLMPSPQDELLQEIIDKLPKNPLEPSQVSEDTRKELASVVRNHYRKHPEATKLQAQMDMEWWNRMIKR